jgi:aspartate aminotransferase
MSSPLGLRVAPSATARVEERVAAMRREGRPLYRLGLGEPDFALPEHITQAAIRAIHGQGRGYTDTAGIHALREAIADRFQDVGIQATPQTVMATAGAKQAIAHALAVLCAPGEEVLIPSPYWVSFPEQVRLVEGEPRFIPSEGAKVTAEELEAAVSNRSRVLILNSPNNPSGAVYTQAELEAIATVCQRRDLWVISDEVYRAFVYTNDGHASISTVPGMSSRTVIVDSASKTYGMPGWRIGYATGPVDVIRAMTAVASHTTSNPSTIAQAGGEAALRGSQAVVVSNRAEYADRVAMMAGRLGRMPHLSIAGATDGGFFAWVDVSSVFGCSLGNDRIDDVEALAEVALATRGVVLQPGTAFGSSRHLRMSVAAPRDELEEGLELLAGLLRGLSRGA